MNHEKWIKLSDESKNIKIAELDGWKKLPPENHCQLWEHPTAYEYEGKYKVARTAAQLPDYINDLNAMHEAEKKIDSSWTGGKELLSSVYLDYLADITGTSHIGVQQELVMATAAERAEAFVLTMEPE